MILNTEKFPIFAHLAEVAVPEIWLPYIEQLTARIQAEADSLGLDVRVLQIKEKFGGLRYYVSGANEQISQWISEVEQASYSWQ